MAKKRAMIGWIAAGVALLVAVAVVPALSGAAGATSIAPAATSSSTSPWSYGGQGWSNQTVQFGNATMSWHSMFGWTVTFNVTQTSPGNWTVKEVRTLGVTFNITANNSVSSYRYQYHAQEIDTAFANITNSSVVYSDGTAVPALGVVNASASMNGLMEQSISSDIRGHARSGFLNVTGEGNAQTSFTPSLGLIPLNLTGISSWNSSAMAHPSAAWSIDWTWDEQGFNGTVGSGSGSNNGSLNANATVTVRGLRLTQGPPFTAAKGRTGIVLILSGPFDLYDGYLLIPHAFDLFGGGAHGYANQQFGSCAISSEDLYLSAGPGGPAVTAAAQTFGSTDAGITGQLGGGITPAASAPASPGSTVYGQPISYAEAQSIDHSLTNTGTGGSSAAGPMSGGMLLAVLVGVAAVAVVGTVGVIEWRSYSRRKSKGGLGGGYSGAWSNGAPPASAIPPATQGPTSPPSGPGTAEDPDRPA